MILAAGLTRFWEENGQVVARVWIRTMVGLRGNFFSSIGNKKAYKWAFLGLKKLVRFLARMDHLQKIPLIY